MSGLRISDQDECGLVQGRMSDFVTNKLAQTSARIAQLQTLETQLANVIDRLAAEEGRPGPCDDNCACNEVADDASGLAIGPKPTSLDQDEPPIACTLGAADVAPRMAQWQALRAKAIDQARIEGGRRVRFPYDQDLATELALLVVSEQACCAFLGFSFEIGDNRIVLEVTAPGSAGAVLDALLGTA